METACQKRRPCIEAGKDVKRKKKGSIQRLLCFSVVVSTVPSLLLMGTADESPVPVKSLTIL